MNVAVEATRAAGHGIAGVCLNERIEDTVDMFGGIGDEQVTAPAIPSFPRLLWISDDGSSGANISSQAFLAGTGCEIRRTAPGDLPNDLSEEEVVFIDSESVGQAAVQLASDLTKNGLRKVAVLREPYDGMPCRRQTPVLNSLELA